MVFIFFCFLPNRAIKKIVKDLNFSSVKRSFTYLIFTFYISFLFSCFLRIQTKEQKFRVLRGRGGRTCKCLRYLSWAWQWDSHRGDDQSGEDGVAYFTLTQNGRTSSISCSSRTCTIYNKLVGSKSKSRCPTALFVS